MTSIRHRGVTVSPHGRRWRFKWEGTWVTRNTLPGALQELDELIERRDRRQYIDDVRGLTIELLVDEWWGRKQRELRESSQMRYESVIRLHIRPRIGPLSADHIRPLDIEDFYSRITYKTALVSRDVLRPAFRWGLSNGLVHRVDGASPFDIAVLRRSRCLDGDPDADARATRQVEERLVPDTHEIEKLLADAEERGSWKWWLYLRMAPSLGARPGEQCALQRGDLVERAGTISITKSANKESFKVTPPKRGSSIRTLYVGTDFFEDIMPMVGDLEPDGYLFPATGQRAGVRKLPCWNANAVHRELRKATERLGLPHYTPHSFRHYCATHLLDQGWPPMQVARWLGHRNDTMVRLLYAAHIVEDTWAPMGEAAGRLVRRQASV